MKKNLSIFLLLLMCLMGCWGGVVSHSNAKPEDSIAETVFEVIGDDYWYMGRSESLDGERVNYGYLVRNSDETCINNIAETILKIELDERPYAFTFYQETSNGVYERVFQLVNYVEDSDGSIEFYEKAYCLRIVEIYFGVNKEWDIHTFTSIENIRHLEISEFLQGKAEEAGIDWFEVWPDLEGVETF